MHVAQPPSPPDIDQMIQHKDVHDVVRKELGLAESVKSEKTVKKPDPVASDHNENSMGEEEGGLLSRIKALFGGQP